MAKSRRFFTVRGVKHGLGEIDLLAIRHEPGATVIGWHVEVQASFRPVRYIAKLTGEMARASTGPAPTLAQGHPSKSRHALAIGCGPNLERRIRRRCANVFGQTSNGHTISSTQKRESAGNLRCFNRKASRVTRSETCSKSYRAAAITTFPGQPAAISLKLLLTTLSGRNRLNPTPQPSKTLALTRNGRRDRSRRPDASRADAGLSPSALVVLGWRRGLRVRGQLCGRVQLPQRRAQRIKPRGVGKSVAYDGLPDGRCRRGKLGGGEVNCRHGPPPTCAVLAAPSRRATCRRSASPRCARSTQPRSRGTTCRSAPRRWGAALRPSLGVVAVLHGLGVQATKLDALRRAPAKNVGDGLRFPLAAPRRSDSAPVERNRDLPQRPAA